MTETFKAGRLRNWLVYPTMNEAFKMGSKYEILPGGKFATHCWLQPGETFSPDRLRGLVERSLFTLEEHDVSTTDFDGFPGYPPDCILNQRLQPFTELAKLEWTDTEVEHLFRLSSLKPSLAQFLADISEQETDSFCKRWSEHWIYSPFQGWEAYSPQEAFKKYREDARIRLRRFFPVFRALCQQAIASQNVIYFLWEQHSVPISD